MRCIWLFIMKYKANDTKEKYKTKLVPNGYKCMELIIKQLLHMFPYENKMRSERERESEIPC